ncbi:MAG: sigma-54-dependent Fis family transcriptional regulator [Deltaproteobacteria bacterium]|nr:MAG: sigma-54-dependent Fis family transcriptional regulator [Deltaproteobacteria bacterium]
MNKSRILVVDDEAIARENLEHILRKDGYDVVTADSGITALKKLSNTEFDLVMTDLKMKQVDGMEVLARTKEQYPETEVVMLTAYATLSTAIEAMQKGAYHYIPKPYKIDEVRMIAKRALEKKALKDEIRVLKRDSHRGVGIPFIIGKSSKIQELVELVDQIAPTDCNVLIFGETGTGKELFARAIHHQSGRAGERFLAFNCGAFTEDLLTNELFGHEKDAFTGATTTKIGLLEAANRGTVFLDEIGDMPASMQVKLLRVIEEKSVLRVGGTQPIKVDIRIVAATNKDLKREVETGGFRKDLFYRLNVVSLQLPPLAERRDDVPLLAHHFLARYAEGQGKSIEGFSDEAMEVLLNYEYPGNIRELENIVERAVVLCNQEEILAKHLPQELGQYCLKVYRQSGQRFPTLEENEVEYVSWVLKQVDGNKTKAAEILGIDRVSLWRKLKRWGMEEDSQEAST